MNKKLMLSFSSLILLICTPFIFVSCSSSNKITYNAHRGLSSQYFENTKDAFIAAGQNKYFDGIETDVYLTMDYNIVCSHAKNPFRVLPSDQTISYQKDGYNYDTNQEQNSGKSFIYENTYAETVNRELWTGVEVWNGPTNSYVIQRDDPNTYGMSGSFHVPSFKEYLNICHNYQKSPIIEIKNDVPNTGFNWTDQHNDQYNYMILINAVINAGEWNNNTHFLLFYNHETVVGQSLYDAFLNFEKANISTFGSLKNQPVLEELLWEEGETTIAQVKEDVYRQIDKNHNVSLGNYYIDEQMVKYAHRKKVKIGVWTVNTIEEQSLMIKWGVNSITSNFVLKH